MKEEAGREEVSTEPSDGGLDGEAPRVHRPRRALPTDVVRPTRAEVHLSALRYNLSQLRKTTRAPIWSVVKADAYGHGAKAVGRTLERAGTDGLCVALVEEGVELREAGIRLPILVMGGYYGDAFRELVHHRLTPVLSDVDQVAALHRACSYGGGARFACHVKVDTGMARLGVRRDGWGALIQSLNTAPMLEVEDADLAVGDVFEEPLRLFAEATSLFASSGIVPPVRHLANSGGLLRDARTHFDMVRPGAALFGVDPLVGLADPLGGPGARIRLKSTMTVMSRVVSLRALKAGDTVGYGANYVAPGDRVIATVPMGYADGLSRTMSNRGMALVCGSRVPIVGNISMDMTAIDVSELPHVRLGDDVVFLGGQGADCITVEEVAQWSKTIPWEILTNVSRRVPRFYREA